MPYLGQAPKEPLEEMTPEFPGMLAEAQGGELRDGLIGIDLPDLLPQRRGQGEGIAHRSPPGGLQILPHRG
jgi:hypothetical protein